MNVVSILSGSDAVVSDLVEWSGYIRKSRSGGKVAPEDLEFCNVLLKQAPRGNTRPYGISDTWLADGIKAIFAVKPMQFSMDAGENLMKFLETLNKDTSALPLAPGFSHDDVTGIAAKAVRFFSVSDPAENKSPEESDVVPAPSFSMAFSKRDLRPIQALEG